MEALLSEPEQGDGPEGEGEHEFGSTDCGTAYEGDADHDVERAAGHERGGEAEGESPLPHGDADEAEAGAGGPSAEEGRAGQPDMKAESDAEQDDGEDPWQHHDGRAGEFPEGPAAEAAGDDTDGGVGAKAADVVERGCLHLLVFAAFESHEAAGDRAAHAGAVEAGGESGDKGSGGRVDGFNGWHDRGEAGFRSAAGYAGKPR
jgi:hypothetical protein